MATPQPPSLSRQAANWGAVVAWLLLFHEVTWRGSGSGKRAFVWMMCALVLLLGTAVLSPALEHVGLRRPRWTERVFRAVLWLSIAQPSYDLVRGLRQALRLPKMATSGVDISLNTNAAAEAFLRGLNPYVEKAQLWVTLAPGPHVEVQGSQTLIHGLPYTNGYPYFPMMFLSFIPFRPFAEGLNGMRIGILVLLLLSILGGFLLARRLVPAGRVGTAVACMSATLLGLAALLSDEFGNAVPDYVMGVYALFAFVMLSRGRPVAAGILFGLAQACKLLPGPFLVAPALLSLWGTPAFRKLLVAYVVTSVAIIGPFVLASPSHFLTSTILFYVVNHGHGDNTALWYYLSPAARPFFTAAGMLLSGGLVAAAWWRRGHDALWPMTLSFASYLVFIAFARMAHVNYYWSIYVLGCTAFAMHLSRVGPAQGGRTTG